MHSSLSHPVPPAPVILIGMYSLTSTLQKRKPWMDAVCQGYFCVVF